MAVDLEIKFDSWRQDVYNYEGKLIQENVLFIRARKETSVPGCAIEFHIPIWHEDPEEELVIYAKEVLVERIAQFEKEHGDGIINDS